MAQVVMKATQEDLDRAKKYGGAKWQVIFKTHEGLDYTRLSKSLDDYDANTIQTYAKNQINAFHSVIGGAVIEVW